MGLIPDRKRFRDRWVQLQSWEEGLLHARSPEFGRALEWLCAARELAAKLDPEWGSRRHAEAHWQQLTAFQQTMARVRFSR